MRPMFEISSRIAGITCTVLYASLIVQDLIRLGGEKVEFDVSGLTTSVALHIDTDHLIPMSNRPRSWRVERKTKGGEDAPRGWCRFQLARSRTSSREGTGSMK